MNNWDRNFLKHKSKNNMSDINKILAIEQLEEIYDKKGFDIRRNLSSPDKPDSWKKMDEDLLFTLKDLFCELQDMNEKIPFITSGYRTKSHNKKVGGVATSSHRKGLAVDFSIRNSNDKFNFVQTAIYCGFKRIGVYKKFIHLDLDTSKEPAIW